MASSPIGATLCPVPGAPEEAARPSSLHGTAQASPRFKGHTTDGRTHHPGRDLVGSSCKALRGPTSTCGSKYLQLKGLDPLLIQG